MIHAIEAGSIADRLHAQAMAELHPLLAAKVVTLLSMLGGRFKVRCGRRGKAAQLQALESGDSDAGWLESPHNFGPALPGDDPGTPTAEGSLAADLALDHRVVPVEERADAPGWPNLWSTATPEAREAWADLDAAAKVVGLERVNLRSGRDAPHVQLPGWRSYLTAPA